MTPHKQLEFLTEPELRFGFEQRVAHPKDGLALFGPHKSASGRMRVGLVSTIEGKRRYIAWVNSVARPIAAKKGGDPNHTLFPGFEAVFGVEWPTTPAADLRVDASDLQRFMHTEDRHQAIFGAVGLYANAIEDYLRSQGDITIDLWMVVVPEFVYALGRPKSMVPRELRQPATLTMDKKTATRMLKTSSLFAEDNKAAEMYRYDLNFHNQLKARLLGQKAPIQVIRETTLTPGEFQKKNGMPLRTLQDPATLAWNLTTTAYFKAFGQPWRLGEPRPGVCYVGIVFKRDDSSVEDGNACCGAQMFLDSGDGVVFRGAVGPWYAPDKKSFHLTREKARELMSLVVGAYQNAHSGEAPTELFIHGKTHFSAEEWEGFRETVPPETKVACIRIRESPSLKLFRTAAMPVPRGVLWVASERRAYLWTKGFIPRLQTYPGREVPNPLVIDVTQGDADIRMVARDVLALTKLNYNACIYGDGVPVTLRFADAIGEILTAGPIPADLPPLPFRYYI